MLQYIEHILCELEQSKIAFEKQRLINLQLSPQIFNYLKFYIISQLVQYIKDYGTAINYDIVYINVIYKYFLKTFYNKTV